MATTKAALGRLAVEVRTELGLSMNAPFDPHLWAEEYGIPFVSLQELQDVTDAVEHFMRNRPERWSAALVKNGSGHLVVYNTAHSPARVRSDLAHEVAHLVAEHALDAGWMDEQRCSGASKPQELEATELAGALLIPNDSAISHAVKGGTAEGLAAAFGVSVEMATWRIRASGGQTIADRWRRRSR